ncbi:hypothetical protein CELL_00260 [Cellulomonas sp. T2.31MG-18]|uniref:hypothetical protein n=1 Tax=Cellulomonas sp. T2.31MG-18 TaxID=3157619 RepID=UPI0035E61FB3
MSATESTSALVGGTAIAGGRGSMFGHFLGVTFITLIGNGLVLLGVNSSCRRS